MKIKLNQNDNLTIETGSNDENWVTVASGKWESCLAVGFLKSNQYLEIRKKQELTNCFFFENKRAKKEFDFGWWSDAEIIFSLNEVKHNQ